MENIIAKLFDTTGKLWVTEIAIKVDKPVMEVESILINSNLFLRKMGQWQLSLRGLRSIKDRQNSLV